VLAAWSGWQTITLPPDWKVIKAGHEARAFTLDVCATFDGGWWLMVVEFRGWLSELSLELVLLLLVGRDLWPAVGKQL